MNTIAPKLQNDLANAINDKEKVGSSFAIYDAQRDINKFLSAWETHIRWTAQTIHQAYHLRVAESWLECPRNTCDSARQVLEIKEYTHEEILEKRLLDDGFDPEVVKQIVSTGDAGTELSTE